MEWRNAVRLATLPWNVVRTVMIGMGHITVLKNVAKIKCITKIQIVATNTKERRKKNGKEN